MKTKLKHLAIITITTGLLSQFSFAQTMQTRDLWFLPTQGQVQSTTEIGYSNSEIEFDAAGVPKLKQSEFAAGQTLSYAVTDQLHVGAQVAFSSEKNDTLTSTTTKESNSASGIKDPTVGVLYRALKQEDSKLFLDLKFLLSPSLGKSKTSNVLRGSTNFIAQVVLGQNNGDFEYSITPELSYYTDQKFDSGTTYKSKFDFGVSVDTQYDFNETAALNAGLAFVLPGKDSEKGGTDEISTDYVVSLLVGPSFQLIENLSVDVGLNYSYASGEADISLGTSDYKIRGLSLGASLDYVF